MLSKFTTITAALLLSFCVRAEPPPSAAPAPGKSPGASQVSVMLRDGSQLCGELLATRAGRHIVLIGDTLVELPVEDVVSVSAVREDDATVPGGAVQAGLYRIGGGESRSIQEQAAELGKGIVQVKTARGAGTGWFVNDQGYLVTNSHVVQRERSVSVTIFEDTGKGFGKRVFKRVRIVAVSDDIDLALLRIEEPIDIDYPAFSLAASNDVSVGDRCFTIGNPLGLERSTSVGEVSSNSRQLSGRLFLQTTAPIAPGNSGGPLLNDLGEVIGVINMGAVYMDGIGFAIPVRYLKEFLDNAEAFAYDPDNPNNGMQYMETPVTATDDSFAFTDSDFIRTGFGTGNLTLADIDGDGAKDIVYANNNKSEIRICEYADDKEADGQDNEDYEDINRLNYSRFFNTRTVPVRSRIQSLAVGDINDDGRPDLVCLGDIDGLSVLYQKKDGQFSDAEKIADVDAAPRQEALRIADLDDDGDADIFVLGKHSFNVFFSGSDRRQFALNSDFRSRIADFHLIDVNEDDRLDVVFLVKDRFVCTRVRLQGADGQFAEEYAVNGVLSGPVRRLNNGPEPTFIALDKGANRVRRLKLLAGRDARKETLTAPALLAVPVDASDSGHSPAFDFADIDGKDGGELLIQDNSSHEFVVCSWSRDGVREVRSPSPRKVADCRLHRSAKGKAAVFCLSREDRLFGAGKVARDGTIEFPRPMASAVDVQYMDLVEVLAGGKPVSRLIWLEKKGSTYSVRAAEADAIADLVHIGGAGALDIPSVVLKFRDSKGKEAGLANKPDRLVFADLNHDGDSDLIVYWSYSGKETVYTSKEGVYEPVNVPQNILADFKEFPLEVVDLQGDGECELLQVHPEFVRLLAMDEQGNLFIERQFNWGYDEISRLVPYSGLGSPGRFLVFNGMKVKWVSFDRKAASFETDETWDLAGIGVGETKVGDFDGDDRPDILSAIPGGVQLFLNRAPGMAQNARVLLDHDLEERAYWNLATGLLAPGDTDHVLLFDAKKAMIEIYKFDPDKGLRQVLRHRLAERTIFQYGGMGGQKLEIPQGTAIGDVNGDGRGDLVLVLADRVAVYLQ